MDQAEGQKCVCRRSHAQATKCLAPCDRIDSKEGLCLDQKQPLMYPNRSPHLSPSTVRQPSILAQVCTGLQFRDILVETKDAVPDRTCPCKWTGVELHLTKLLCCLGLERTYITQQSRVSHESCKPSSRANPAKCMHMLLLELPDSKIPSKVHQKVHCIVVCIHVTHLSSAP